MGKVIRYFIKYCLCLFMICGLTACGDEGCTQNVIGYTIAEIQQTNQSDETAIKSFSVYGINVGKDTALITNDTKFQGISLLLNPDSTYTELKFDFAVGQDTIADTLSFYYKNQPYFVSIDCGCSLYNYIDSVLFTKHLINQIDIINPEVTNEKTPNIKILY